MISYHWPNTTAFNKMGKDNNGICLSFRCAKKYMQGEQESSVRPAVYKNICLTVWCEALHLYSISKCALYSFQVDLGEGSRVCFLSDWARKRAQGRRDMCSGARVLCNALLCLPVNLILSLCFSYLDGIQGLINRHSSFNLLTQ